MTHWALEVSRSDLSDAVVVDQPPPVCGEGQAVLRPARVGVTANNVTYAVLGVPFRYWEFFPADDEQRGRVPLWGFAEVVESRAPGVDVGTRVYGYLPPASALVVTLERPDGRGFRDGSAHRRELPSPYNAYATTTGDAAYEPDREDLQVLFRPLFFTSFVLADAMVDGGLQGATSAVLSSASSKTAYGTAWLLRRAGVRTVGLTSAANVAFTEGLGTYDRVLSYDQVQELPLEPTAYLDVSGSSAVRQALHDHLRTSLVLDLVVGITSQDGERAGTLHGARPTGFFAPDRIRKRSEDWGRDGLDDRFGDAWRAFAPVVEGWVDVRESRGPQGLRDVWLEVAAGRSAPRDGHVVALV